MFLQRRCSIWARHMPVEMFSDAIKCFTQSLERGLDKEQSELCEKQISRCRLLSREQSKRQAKS